MRIGTGVGRDLGGLGVWLTLTVLLLAAFATTAAARPVRAHAARTVSLSDTARLRLSSHHGFTLNEQGTASGSLAGKIYIRLKVASTNRVTAEVELRPSGGTVIGYATADYRPSGALARFSGTLSVRGGSGRYRHATGSGLGFTGSIRRTDDAVTVRVSGRFSV